MSQLTLLTLGGRSGTTSQFLSLLTTREDAQAGDEMMLRLHGDGEDVAAEDCDVDNNYGGC